MVEGHPEPPDDLHERELELVDFDSTLWRIADREYRESPLHFGFTGRNRFDAPDGSYRVCYFALAFRGAFLETLGRDLHINFVTPEALSSRVAATVCVEPSVRLVDLTNQRLRLLGADSRLNSTMNRPLTQRWSRAIHSHPARPDGILYRSRLDPEQRSVAAFERSAEHFSVAEATSLNEDSFASTLEDAVNHYWFGFIE
ncbi:MAG: RES family NAD+ phosphorylase [Myxococcota bacterium]